MSMGGSPPGRNIRNPGGGSGYEYDYDYAGKRILTWVPGYGITEQQHYWDNRQFAYWAEDGSTYFVHRDALGTERMRTNYSGAISSQYSSSALPFNYGDTTVPSGSGSDQETLRFAGLDKDSSTTDNAQFRQYSQTQGRWMSPDPFDGSMDLGNPQSLNRYSYVGNNPLWFTDPSGLNALGVIANIALCFGGSNPASCIAEVSSPVGWAVLGAGVLLGALELLDHHPAYHGPDKARPNANSGRTCIGPNCGKPDPTKDLGLEEGSSAPYNYPPQMVNFSIPGIGGVGPSPQTGCDQVARFSTGAMHAVAVGVKESRSQLVKPIKAAAPYIGAYAQSALTALGVGGEAAASVGALTSGAAEGAGALAALYGGYVGVRDLYGYYKDPMNACPSVP